MKGAVPVGPVDPSEEITVTVLLRRREDRQPPDVVAATDSSQGLMSSEELAANFGADPADVDLIRDFAEAHGLEVGQVNMAGRTISLSGPASAMSEAFGVALRRYRYPGGEYRGREGVITVPAEIAGVVQGVFGLDNRPQAAPKIHRMAGPSGGP